ncbi:hypothetical protein PVAND_014057 [Polypedilum vanderplanki]|uniref:CRAL-TRIO domain-containing protein n=1 Tax=Polypedilum vanderplanki TaxID=319348 RepID=A0A9J6CT21_POLVA|nr:hypothetical protein PVAND_014057 [Polypedilum vanderplanki]
MSDFWDEYDNNPTAPDYRHYHKPCFNNKVYGSGKMESDKMVFNKHDANERYRALIILKDLIGASRDLALRDKSCYSDDEFLYRFLFARKFNVSEAFQLLINYQLYRQKNHDLLQRLCVLDDTIQMALRDGFPGVLRKRDRRGRKVLVFFASNWDFTQYSLLTVYRAMLLTLEKLIENKQNQANGFVAIVDWTNFTLKQSAHLNPKILKLMIEGLQDSFPVRFKGIHFIGQPWFVEAALSVIKPFLNAKTRERIKLHGSNLSTLHEAVARDILPSELGGEDQYNPLEWYHLLLESSQINAAPPHYCITQTIPYSKTPQIIVNNTSSVNSNNNNNRSSDDELIVKSSKAQQYKSIAKCNNLINDSANNTLLNFSE